ncbi:hypothetical protein [Nocardia salmonicida]|uniref:hypothetical protein n=1 Tax=Nocardia salmonicida TaxID=53431 RepID=UPI0037B081CB
MNTTRPAEPEISVSVDADGMTLVQIATAHEAGRLRVIVNDGPVFDGVVFDARPDVGDHDPAVHAYAAELGIYAAEVAAAAEGRR